MNRRCFTALAAALLVIGASLPAAVTAAGPRVHGTSSVTKARFNAAGVYIVQLADRPVVSYTGGIRDYKATKAAPGSKIDPLATDVVRYAGYLTAKHDALLSKVGGATKLYSYVYSYNGFAARLTAAQANKLLATPGVLTVAPDELRTLDTSSTPSFLGLDAPGGLWDQLGGFGHAGENIIIGDVDSGIWPESLSFSDRVGPNGAPSSSPSAKRAYQQIPGWNGKCTPGEAFSATNCNQKLIGARFYDAAWADPANGLSGNQVLAVTRPWEYLSPRDYNGHGSHTASTAGGNHGTPVTGPAAVFGTISGMAPRARIAAYKALWSTQDGSTASGFTSDLVEAIDQAVSDGVDVINYSISGTSTNFVDPVEVSFLFAADAGIFVSESAGNSGPAASTVAHPGPWTTTVAAGTHNRSAIGSVTLGNGSTFTGASVAPNDVSAPLIDSTAAGASGASATAVALCFSTATNGGTAALDPAKVAGKIVVCDRGTN